VCSLGASGPRRDAFPGHYDRPCHHELADEQQRPPRPPEPRIGPATAAAIGLGTIALGLLCVRFWAADDGETLASLLWSLGEVMAPTSRHYLAVAVTVGGVAIVLHTDWWGRSPTPSVRSASSPGACGGQCSSSAPSTRWATT
jgi:hypothetical protein